MPTRRGVVRLSIGGCTHVMHDGSCRAGVRGTDGTIRLAPGECPPCVCDGPVEYLVPKAGLEPARLAPHAPQTCVSAIPPLRHSAGSFNPACHHVLGALNRMTAMKHPSWDFTHPGLLAGSYHEPCGEAPKSAHEGKGGCIIEVAQNSCQ